MTIYFLLRSRLDSYAEATPGDRCELATCEAALVHIVNGLLS